MSIENEGSLEPDSAKSDIKKVMGYLLLSVALVILPSQLTSKRVEVKSPHVAITLGQLEPTADAASLQDLVKDTPVVVPEPAPEPPQAVVVPEVIPTPPPVVEPVKQAPVKPKSHPKPVGDAKAFIYQKESGNNPHSVNKSSGACGLGQALPCSKMPCAMGDYACQDAFFTQYMKSRYGSWENARSFWLTQKAKTGRGWW